MVGSASASGEANFLLLLKFQTSQHNFLIANTLVCVCVGGGGGGISVCICGWCGWVGGGRLCFEECMWGGEGGGCVCVF